jgi:hypothetical protein
MVCSLTGWSLNLLKVWASTEKLVEGGGFESSVSCGLQWIWQDCGSSNITRFCPPPLQYPDSARFPLRPFVAAQHGSVLSSLRFLVLNQLPGYPSPAIFAATGFRISIQPRAARAIKKGRNMANNNDDDVPFMQKLLDNHFLLLFLGVASPGVLYILWGIVDIMSVPLAK